jgi:AraC-like DNA-binding protein
MDQLAETSGRDYDRVARAIRYVAANRLDQPSLEEVADAMGLSPFHAQRLFTRWAGLSPKRFLGLLTVEHAKALLRSTSESVMGAAYEVGLSGSTRLHDLFVTFEAITPGEYKAAGADLVLRGGCTTPRSARCSWSPATAGWRGSRSSTGSGSTKPSSRPRRIGRSAGSPRTRWRRGPTRKPRSGVARRQGRCGCSPKAPLSRSRSGGR